MQRREFLAITTAAAFIANPARAAVNFTVSPVPTAVSQGNQNLCWLAASAVMFNYRDAIPYSLSSAAQSLGPNYQALQSQGSALRYSELDAWLSAGGFTREGQQSIEPKGIEAKLRAHGPLIVLVDGNGSAQLNHAVVITGIKGSGTFAGTDISFADGQTGTIKTLVYTDFYKVFDVQHQNPPPFSIAYFS